MRPRRVVSDRRVALNEMFHHIGSDRHQKRLGLAKKGIAANNGPARLPQCHTGTPLPETYGRFGCIGGRKEMLYFRAMVPRTAFPTLKSTKVRLAAYEMRVERTPRFVFFYSTDSTTIHSDFRRCEMRVPT